MSGTTLAKCAPTPSSPPAAISQTGTGSPATRTTNDGSAANDTA
jgi:hypothetical protein